MDQPSYTSRRGVLNLIMGLPLWRVAGGALCLGFGRPRAAAAGPIEAPGGLTPPETAEVARVLDGNTLQLGGGDRLRLAGLETPSPGLAANDDRMSRLAESAKAALRDLIGSHPVTLRYDVAPRDRYGRRVGHAFNSGGIWLQAEMIAAGHGRVHGDGRNRLGLRTLLQLEAEARRGSRGLWRHQGFAVRAADDPTLERAAGSFQIIEGRAYAAAIAGGIGFINFGADRKTDLTLVLTDPALDLGGPAMDDLGWLTGKPIRCRGWLDLYDGPRIDISHGEQIEVLEY
jgi:micrococcal nuclease